MRLKLPRPPHSQADAETQLRQLLPEYALQWHAGWTWTLDTGRSRYQLTAVFGKRRIRVTPL